MTTLTRRVYDVHLNPEDYDPLTADPFDTSGVTTVRTVVLHADQMVGEREAMKRGITLDQPQNVTSVIVWCALKRAGAYDGSYESFRDVRCFDISNAPRPGGSTPADSETEEEVPPTREPSGSASSVLGTSPASSTGSTPT